MAVMKQGWAMAHVVLVGLSLHSPAFSKH